MTELQRHKLLFWLVSVMTLIFFTVVWIMVSFTLDGACPDPLDQTMCLARRGYVMIFYPPAFIMIVVWHGSDALQTGQASRHTVRILMAYPIFFGTMAFAGVLLAMMASGRFEQFYTYPSMFGPHGYYAPSRMLSYPFYFLVLFAIVLCTSKFVVAVRGLLKKAK